MRTWDLLCLSIQHRSSRHRRSQGWQWRESRTVFSIDFWKLTRSSWSLIFKGNILGLFKSSRCLRKKFNKLLIFIRKYIKILIALKLRNIICSEYEFSSPNCIFNSNIQNWKGRSGRQDTLKYQTVQNQFLVMGSRFVKLSNSSK